MSSTEPRYSRAYLLWSRSQVDLFLVDPVYITSTGRVVLAFPADGYGLGKKGEVSKRIIYQQKLKGILLVGRPHVQLCG